MLTLVQASDAAGPSKAAVPKTPSKQRVSKAKAVPKKKTPARAAKKSAKDVEESGDEQMAVESPSEEMAVKAVKAAEDNESGSGNEESGAEV